MPWPLQTQHDRSRSEIRTQLLEAAAAEATADRGGEGGLLPTPEVLSLALGDNVCKASVVGPVALSVAFHHCSCLRFVTIIHPHYEL